MNWRSSSTYAWQWVSPWELELLKIKVKLLGEFVARASRQPDPIKVQAIKDWGKISCLKEVQEFLGTTNYSRLFMGPKYAAASEGLRPSR